MMTLRSASLLLASAMLATACSPKVATDGSPAGETTAAAFMGSWKVTGHIVGPWFSGPGFDPEPDAEILGKLLVLAETGVTGPAPLTCEKATYAAASLPAEGLFEGNVPDKYIAKSALGIEQDQTPTLTVSCVSDTSDVEFHYHLIGKDKLLLGLSNIVYQFGRDTSAN